MLIQCEAVQKTHKLHRGHHGHKAREAQIKQIEKNFGNEHFVQSLEDPVPVTPTVAPGPPIASSSSTGLAIPPFGLSPLDLPGSTPLSVDDQLLPLLKPGDPMDPNQSVDTHLTQAQALLTQIEDQLDKEKAWGETVRDIIQNYQFKYSKVLDDIKSRSAKVDKLQDIIGLLKKAQLHSVLDTNLAKAQDQLLSLMQEGNNDPKKSEYSSIKDKVEQTKTELEKLEGNSVHEVLDNIDTKLQDAIAEVIPPDSTDVLEQLARPDDVSPGTPTPTVPAVPADKPPL
jgi:hypothetical protein